MSPDLQNPILKLPLLTVVLLAGSLLGGCDRPAPEANQDVEKIAATPAVELDGKQLADRHCVRCHLAPIRPICPKNTGPLRCTTWATMWA